MTTSYDLLTRPWVAVLDQQGRTRFVGLREALVEADRFRALAVPDAGAEAAVLRMMVAVTQAAIRGPGRDDPFPSEYPSERVVAYLDTVADRFDLFSPTHPFLQATHTHSLKAGTPSMLGFPFLPGSSKIMTPTGYADPNDAVRSGDAAAMLLTIQAWGNGQATSGPLPGSTNNSTPAGVLAGSVNVYPLGDTLAETLRLNLSPTAEVGVPVWEVESGQAPSGWLGRLVWPARSYLLKPSDDGEHVLAVHFGAGHPVPDTGLVDPHLVLRKNGKHVRCSDRQPWRDVPVIYGWADEGGSEQLQTASNLLAEEGRSLGALVAYGRDNAGMTVASLQVRAVFPLPVKMLGQGTEGESVARERLEGTGRAIGSLRWALTDLSNATDGAWDDVEEPYLHLLTALADDPDDPERVDAAGATYARAARAALLGIFEREGVVLPPIKYGHARSLLMHGLNKHLPFPTPTEEQR